MTDFRGGRAGGSGVSVTSNDLLGRGPSGPSGQSTPDGRVLTESAFLRSVAAAVETGEPTAVKNAADAITGILRSSVTAAPYVLPALALLGQTETVFAVLDRYLLNRGSFGRPFPPRLQERRYTDMLFLPPMAGVRRDPRFAELMRAIGLDQYWRSTGTRPQVIET